MAKRTIAQSKHTPGPWRLVAVAEVRDDGKAGDCFGVHDAHFLIQTAAGEDVVSASCSDGWVDAPGDHWPVISEANARLIAAAPELLEALKDAKAQIRALCSSSDVPDSVNAVIAKAEGKS